jgi:hypothetical protein
MHISPCERVGMLEIVMATCLRRITFEYTALGAIAIINVCSQEHQLQRNKETGMVL